METMHGGALPDGLYEAVISNRLGRYLAQLDPEEWHAGPVDPGDQPHVLANYFSEALRRRLEEVTQPERLALVNALLALVDDEERVGEARRLLGVERVGRDRLAGAKRFAVRPHAPVSEAALLTNAPGEPSLQSEIMAELPSADQVDLLCAFVKWTGVRTIRSGLEHLKRYEVPFRVITTTYMGATERAALDRLVRELGAEVKIHYDVQRTRLHAKAWMFRRNSGFSTAYVGSSNLSHAALLDGVEWNVRLSQCANRALLAKFVATFDTYWSDPTFEHYDPDNVEHRDRLDDALAEASGRAQHNRVTISLSGLEVRPYPFQQRMLDDLEAARAVQGRHRNLLVAATGTGKTVVAALDYRRLSEGRGADRPSLLFVAHRREILQQALRTYREVLADSEFGELYVDGARPERWRHVFASIQSLSSYGVDLIPPKSFEVLVVDEFHHAAARTYRRLLDHLEPTETLGLTATPERADGIDVAEMFGHRPTSELRLWDAIASDLLTPFHYFAINDETDLRRVAWARGTYDANALSRLYTGNEARTRIILNQVRDKISDISQMKALGFCVDVAHARAMATAFTQAGVAATAVTGATPSHERDEALLGLRDGGVKVIFTVDVFNEGLDVPDVNTVLFLRPTESATIFVQQLGRGLRRTPSKSVLTALDFVGMHRAEFRWDLKLRALTGLSRRELVDEVERGFSSLPSGSQIILEREARRRILDNVRTQVIRRWPHVVAELRTVSAQRGDVSLREFVEDSRVELPVIIGGSKRSWTQLRREAGLPTGIGGAHEEGLLRRTRAVAHVDDPIRAAAYVQLLEHGEYERLSEAEKSFARMLFFSLFPNGGGFTSYGEGLRALRDEPAVRDELCQIVDLAHQMPPHLTYVPGGPLDQIPLRVHARYQREEILAALGWASLDRVPTGFQTGVLFVEELNIDALFVTVEKSASKFSPTTMYRDFPLSRSQFHWESQSTTSLASPTGQRYITGSSTVILFVRVRSSGELGTEPYTYLGPVSLSSFKGERPIEITWDLEVPMPLDLFVTTSAAAP